MIMKKKTTLFSWLDYVVFRRFHIGICIFISFVSYHSRGPVLRKYGVTAIIGFKSYNFNPIVINYDYILRHSRQRAGFIYCRSQVKKDNDTCYNSDK